MDSGSIGISPADPLPDHRLSLDSIATAWRHIDPVFRDSPQYDSEPLSETLGCELFLKVETNNPIRSFKGRGAELFVARVTERGDDRQLVCASTGNFGQAMAYACRRRDRPLIVYADVDANPLKAGRIAALGAELRRTGDDFDAAKESARSFCADAGAWMIEDGREPEISEGAGTIAVELLQDHEFETILVPVGNGALINGVGRWVKAKSPRTRVIGVSARGADAMEKSWAGHRIVVRDRVETTAEGIAVRVPVPEAVEDMRPLVDDMMLVSDEEMFAAMRLILETTGLVVEPAGATGVAALMIDRARFEDQSLATILTGNNLTPEQMWRWLP
jgi:threonine dehydratase